MQTSEHMATQGCFSEPQSLGTVLLQRVKDNKNNKSLPSSLMRGQEGLAWGSAGQLTAQRRMLTAHCRGVVLWPTRLR